MNTSMLILIGVSCFFIIAFNIFLILFDKKLDILEKQIILLFEKRTNLVPPLYELTKDFLSKHSEVFFQILYLRKIEFSNYEETFLERIHNEIQIHHELNFIFRVISKHPQIQKEGKYLLVKDLFLENSAEIGNHVELYKKMIQKLNFFLYFKNITLVGLFIHIEKRVMN